MKIQALEDISISSLQSFIDRWAEATQKEYQLDPELETADLVHNAVIEEMHSEINVLLSFPEHTNALLQKLHPPVYKQAVEVHEILQTDFKKEASDITLDVLQKLVTKQYLN